MEIERRLWILGTAFVILGLSPLIATNQQMLAAHPQDNTHGGMPAGATVNIDNFSLGPMSIKVAAGTTMTWTNADDVPHTVVSDDTKTFKSRALDTDEQFSYTFTKPGTYEYFCSVHPRMTGEVIVQ